MNIQKSLFHSPSSDILLFLRWAAIVASIFLIGLSLQSCTSKANAETGPNGGDLVSLGEDETQAEVLANSDTGEVMVHTWDKDLKEAQPLESKPLVLGSGDKSITLEPHPLPDDPKGRCSRFYGQANWMRGGNIRHGWIRSSGTQSGQQHFDWKNCWAGGKQNNSMWTGMKEHRRGMGGNHGGGGHRGQ